MKSSACKWILSVLCVIVLGACDRSDDYSGEQKERFNMLTSVMWVQNWTDSSYPENPVTYVSTWSFDTKGNAVCTRIGTDKSGTEVVNETVNYEWAFSSETFEVIHLFSKTNGTAYWYIDKITASRLRVKSSNQDPLLYPYVAQTTLDLVAKPKQ